jgi:hypothetical protein
MDNSPSFRQFKFFGHTEAVRASGVVFDKARADTYGAALGPTIRLMPTLLAGEGNEDREGQYKTRP